MKVSVCITVFNEEDTIAQLLGSLLNQTLKFDEIVIIDSSSTDGTRKIITNYQKKSKRIKLIVKKTTRTQGRNLAIKSARNEIVALTDGSCIAEPKWLGRLTVPFKDKSVDMVAGFYKMKATTALQKSVAKFLGVTPDRFDSNFLPSGRSMAFRKSLWKKVGGFPEKYKGAVDDTIFNYLVVKSGARIVRVKNAVVEWSGVPANLVSFFKKIYNYAKGDAESKIWWHPAKGFESHNIKIILVYLRYLAGILLLYLGVSNPAFLYLLGPGLVFYLLWAYRKAGAWGIPLQFTADLAVMLGFFWGMIGR